MNKKKIISSILLILAIFALAIMTQRKKSSPPIVEPQKQPISVSAISAADSKFLLQKNQYPAMVVSDQEVKITAKSAGTVTVAPGNIGEKVSIGQLLAKIDDTGSSEAGDAGLKSIQVQQSEVAVEIAKKSYNAAKDTYTNLKKSSSSTKAQIDNAKSQRDIAKLQYENALLGLNGSVDNHLITSPISGVITNKTVSVGDSVSAGQLLATISKSSNIKIQFFVDSDQRALLSRGQEISATTPDGASASMLIKNISIEADSTTKRFLIEAYPQKQTQTSLLSGTILTVSVEQKISPKNNDNVILPLSAVSVGQNESYIFTVQNNIAKKTIVRIESVNGETAELSSQISPETLIIIDGNKLVSDGETVSLKR